MASNPTPCIRCPVIASAPLIAMMGPLFHPRNLSSERFDLTIRGPEGAASSLQSLIHRLAKELTDEASLALSQSCKTILP